MKKLFPGYALRFFNRFCRISNRRLLKKKYEEYRYCGGVRHEVGGVDEELSEAIAEDRGEHYLGQDVG